MNRSVSVCYLSVVSFALVGAIPVAAKKREPEKSIFDTCPVAETIRVPADASIDGLQSLAACDDVEVAPADPDEAPHMPPVRISPRTEERKWNAAYQTADLPDDFSPDDFSDVAERNAAAGKPAKRAKPRAAGGERPKRAGSFAIGAAPNGTPFTRITPSQQEVDYHPGGFGGGDLALADVELTSAGAAPGAGAPLSGEGILSMRPIRYQTVHDGMIAQTARRHRVDPLLVHAVIKQESGYKQTARSHVGARGLMQIMPGTGAMLGVHSSMLHDPVTNVDAGTRLLRKLAIKYNGNFDLVLAAYNAGEGAVQKYGYRIPPYRETQDYVRKVMGNYNQLLRDNMAGGAAR